MTTTVPDPSPLADVLREFRTGLWTKEVAAARARVDMDPGEIRNHAGGLDASQMADIESVLRSTYLATTTPAQLASEEGQRNLRDHVYLRYWKTLQLICPWLLRCGDLSHATAVEVGCGTGSSTAAFAQIVRKVEAFEIAGPSIDAARRRLEIMGVDNATIHRTPPEHQAAAIREVAREPVHVFILFAVLEHMTIQERLATLRLAAEVLEPGGLLVIGETPNRLTYFDSHTARLPFFHMLPDDLAAAYAGRSDRSWFVRTMEAAMSRSIEAAIESRIRAGTGVSYHEFEVALGNEIHDRIVLTGYEPEIIASQGSTVEEALLREYLRLRGVEVSPAFARGYLYFVAQKP